MQRIDVLIAAALVVAAAASAIGVMTYEDDRFATFTVSWETRSEEVELPAASRTGPGELETALEITRGNLTRIVFDLVVGGGAVRLQPTAVLIEVVSPTNNTTSVESELPAGPTASVDVPIEIEVGSAPDATTARGSSLEVARDALNVTMSSSVGTGTWTIRASFAATSPGALGDEPYSLGGSVTLESYEAELSLVGPEVGR